MASSIPSPEDVLAFRDAVDRTLQSVRTLPGAELLDHMHPGWRESFSDIRAACADFDRAADLAALQPAKPTATPDDDLLAECERVVSITASHCPPGCAPENCIQHALLARLKVRAKGHWEKS